MIAALALALAAPAFPPAKDLDAEVAGVIARWTGDYRARAGDPPRVAVVRPIAVPKLARRAVFIEVRERAGGPILFQRVIAFADDPARTRNSAASYYFPKPETRARLDQRPVEAAALGPGDIAVFDPRPGNCELNLFQEGPAYTLTAHKESCRIVSRFTPGLIFHPEFRIAIAPGSFAFFEQGFFEDGRAVAPALTYTLDKVIPQ